MLKVLGTSKRWIYLCRYTDGEGGGNGNSPGTNEDYDPHLHRVVENPTT